MLEDEVHILLRQQTKIKLLKESTMKNWKPGQPLIAVRTSSTQNGTSIRKGTEYTFERFRTIPGGPGRCPDCKASFTMDVITVELGEAGFCVCDFETPSDFQNHCKSTIKNQSVLKRLATLPQVTERIEIPVRKQEGAEV